MYSNSIYFLAAEYYFVFEREKAPRYFSLVKGTLNNESLKLGQYHDIIEYRDINLELISISDGFGFNRNNRDISRYRLNIAMYLLA